MVYHSPVFFFLFALFFYSHFNGAFDDAEHSPIGIQDRAKLLSATDQCVLRYLGKMNGRKKFSILPVLIQRCALNEYFSLEEFGNRQNGSSIFTFLPLFQHSHLRKCNIFLFFGTSSNDMQAEMEIVKSSDFEMLNCKYLIMDKKKNIHGLKHFVVLPELNEMHLNDALLQYKDDKDYVIEHLYISEMKNIENFMDTVLKFRRLYSLTVCQITIRLPKTIPDEKIWKFSHEILEDENYILLNVYQMEDYTEFYFFANNEYQCMMRYL